MNQNPHPKNKEVYGCACCSPEFGKIFRNNPFVAKMAAQEPAETAAKAAAELDYGGGTGAGPVQECRERRR